MLRAHRAVVRVDGLSQAGRACSSGAAHLHAHNKSSEMMIWLADSEAVMSRCGLGVAITCERQAGTWQQSAVRSAARRLSSVPYFTCSQVLVVAVDEVGAQIFR